MAKSKKSKFVVKRCLNYEVEKCACSMSWDIVFEDKKGFKFVAEFQKRNFALICARALNKAGLKKPKITKIIGFKPPEKIVGLPK